jgi:hypothetical protein
MQPRERTDHWSKQTPIAVDWFQRNLQVRASVACLCSKLLMIQGNAVVLIRFDFNNAAWFLCLLSNFLSFKPLPPNTNCSSANGQSHQWQRNYRYLKIREF